MLVRRYYTIARCILQYSTLNTNFQLSCKWHFTLLPLCDTIKNTRTPPNGENMKYNKRKFKNYIFFGVLFPIVGIALILIPTFLPELVLEGAYNKIMLISGIVVAFIGVLFLLAAAAEIYKARREYAKIKQSAPKSAPVPQPQLQPQPQPQPEPEPQPVQEEPVQYFPSENAYELVSLGPRQSIEEKFNEIAKMDRSQFIVYIAKLFSIKGYSVKYTPVIDNFDIDLVVEKMGVVIAVGCILTNKVLGEADIRGVAAGVKHYHANNVMALTNMYFDRTALNFAKQEKMSLIDRNILAEDFM